MKRFIATLATTLVLGCSGDDSSTPDAGLTGYGEPCTEDAQCDSGMCVNKFCSKTCTGQADCPVIRNKAFDCGEIKDGVVGCYPRTYDTQPYTMGYDCSLDGKCAVGYRCLGNAGDADRYCSGKCQSDMDCPPKYWCSQVRVGKELEPDKFCRRRQFCHPCVVDDQCGGADDLCVKDKDGNGYCGKACTKTGSACPPYARCEDAGNNKLQCRHKAGICSKPGGGDLCDPCIIHGWTTRAAAGGACTQTSDCAKDQYCAQLTQTQFICLPISYTLAEEGSCKSGAECLLLDRYSGEGACVTSCTDSCPSSGGLTFQCGTITSLDAKYCVPISGGYIGSCQP